MKAVKYKEREKRDNEDVLAFVLGSNDQANTWAFVPHLQKPNKQIEASFEIRQ